LWISINYFQKVVAETKLGTFWKGKPADIIFKTIDEGGINQLIIGKSGKQGLEKFLLEKTTDKVLKASKVPVNVIS